jgi:hypothetical protein
MVVFGEHACSDLEGVLDRRIAKPRGSAHEESDTGRLHLQLLHLPYSSLPVTVSTINGLCCTISSTSVRLQR